MMQDFLSQYKNASSPEDRSYDKLFPKGIKRADFLLFDGLVICEAKVLETVVVRNHVEKLVAKDRTSGPSFRRDIAAPINKVLNGANKQIKATKQALNYPDALGLVIIENTIPDDYSVLTLVSAARRKMLGGLDSVDGVLCIDIANSFSSSEVGRIRPMQLMVRETERSERLGKIMEQVMSDYGEHIGMKIPHGFSIGEGGERWAVDRDGQYKKYEGQFVGTYSTVEEALDWRVHLSRWLNKWWWVPSAIWFLYDQLIAH